MQLKATLSNLFSTTLLFFSCIDPKQSRGPVSSVKEIEENELAAGLPPGMASTVLPKGFVALKNAKPSGGPEECPYVAVAKNDESKAKLFSPEKPDLAIADIGSGSVLIHKGNVGTKIQVYYKQESTAPATNSAQQTSTAETSFLSGIMQETDLFCAAEEGWQNSIAEMKKKTGTVSQNSQTNSTTNSTNSGQIPTTTAPTKASRYKCIVQPAFFWPDESCFSPAEKNSIRNNRIVKKIKRDTLVCAQQEVYQEGSGPFFNYKARLVDDGTPYKCLIETKRLVCKEFCK